MVCELIPFRFPGVPRVRCAFTTRIGGGSEGPFQSANLSFDVGDDPDKVRQNRERVLGLLGDPSWVELRQVHGTAMVFDPPMPADLHVPLGEGDGLATARPGQALVIRTADCQPILLADRTGSHVAALHCGWRGNRAEFPKTGAERFCSRYRLDPRDVFAVRGPSLGPSRAEFVNFDLEWGPGFEDYFDQRKRTMDLWRLTADQLIAAGLNREHIHSVDICTFEREELFFSYRRGRDCGRQAGIVWLEG
jgi:polyphenol oxidase